MAAFIRKSSYQENIVAIVLVCPSADVAVLFLHMCNFVVMI